MASEAATAPPLSEAGPAVGPAAAPAPAPPGGAAGGRAASGERQGPLASMIATGAGNARALSVTVFLLLFMKSWLSAFKRSLALCYEGDLAECSPEAIAMHLGVAVMSNWLLLAVMLLLMWFVQVVVVGVLARPILPPGTPELSPGDGDRPLRSAAAAFSLRLVIAWLMDWRLAAAVGVALCSSLVFSVAVIASVRLATARQPPAAQRRALSRAVAAVYAFVLAATMGFLLYQLWLSAAADMPVRPS